MAHSWPGNVRELRHTLEHACVLCLQDTITLGDLPGKLAASVEPIVTNSARRDGLNGQVGIQALEKAAGNKAKAARMLGIHRVTLYRNIERFGILETPGDVFRLTPGPAQEVARA